MIRGAFNKLPDFFLYRNLSMSHTLEIQYVIAAHLMRWLTNFYDFRFKVTATAGIGIHPPKTRLSQLGNFKNAIWTWGHVRRTICNKILFLNCKKCYWNVRNRLLLEYLAWIEHQFLSVIKRFKESRESMRDDERCGRSKEVNKPEMIGQKG